MGFCTKADEIERLWGMFDHWIKSLYNCSINSGINHRAECVNNKRPKGIRTQVLCKFCSLNKVNLRSQHVKLAQLFQYLNKRKAMSRHKGTSSSETDTDGRSIAAVSQPVLLTFIPLQRSHACTPSVQQIPRTRSFMVFHLPSAAKSRTDLSHCVTLRLEALIQRVKDSTQLIIKEGEQRERNGIAQRY